MVPRRNGSGFPFRSRLPKSLKLEGLPEPAHHSVCLFCDTTTGSFLFKKKRGGLRGETRAYPTSYPNQPKPGLGRVLPDISSSENLKAC